MTMVNSGLKGLMAASCRVKVETSVSTLISVFNNAYFKYPCSNISMTSLIVSVQHIVSIYMGFYSTNPVVRVV